MQKIHYDIPDLRAFSELARTGGFARAAEVLSITPSALSRRIAKLEEAVGGDLVVRSTRTMSLTFLGKRLLAKSEPLLLGLDESVYEASRIARGLEGQMHVGCVSSIAFSLFPEALAVFRARHPDVRVSLVDGEGPRVNAALMGQEVEFAITTLLEIPAELIVELIASDPFVAVMGSSHPLANKKNITWTDVSGQRLVGFKPLSSTRRLLDHALGRRQIDLPWFDEVNELSSLVGYLRSGSFMGIVPRLLSRYMPNAVTVPITGNRIERKIYLARRKDSPLNVPAQNLWASMSEIAAKVPKR